MTLYERIESLRNAKNISQGKLEKELGFSNGSISKWKNSTPTPERLQKIADYFGVSVRYLMTGKDEAFDSDSEALVVAKQLFENPDLLEIFNTLTGKNIERIKTYRDILRALNKENEKK